MTQRTSRTEWGGFSALAPLIVGMGCTAASLPPAANDLSAQTPDLATPTDARAPDLGTSSDLSSVPDLALPIDLGGFCGDPTTPHLRLNQSIALTPATSASLLPLNCCDAAELGYVSMQLPTPVTLRWRHQVGQGPDLPIKLDLANLPAGWSVMVTSGCLPRQGGCTPTDQVDTGFHGTLDITGNHAGYQMSVCLDFDEDPASPHPVIHSLSMWSPPIAAM